MMRQSETGLRLPHKSWGSPGNCNACETGDFLKRASVTHRALRLSSRRRPRRGEPPPVLVDGPPANFVACTLPVGFGNKNPAQSDENSRWSAPPASIGLRRARAASRVAFSKCEPDAVSAQRHTFVSPIAHWL